jgi:putative DNA primase/helicase
MRNRAKVAGVFRAHHVVGRVPLGQHDPESGRLVLSPRRTLPTARAFLREFYHHPEGRLLHAYAGLLLEWRGNRYCEIEEASINCQLQPWLDRAVRYTKDDRRTGTLQLIDFESNPGTMRYAFDAIRADVYLPASTVTPSWLNNRAYPPPLEILSCRSINIHIPTGKLLPATPALFTTTALDFDYDPQAPAAPQWQGFLAELWGDDLDSIRLLQEWFGYCLIADTSLQKMLLLVGPRRSGKGTIGRILARLIGAANVAGPTTSSLAGAFGLQPLMGKSLAIVSDARFTGEQIGIVVERLLCISGEDALTIDRKFMGAVTTKLPTRFMFLTNELPRFNDASTALAGRFLVLRLTRTFYGIEDPTLTARLSTELCGILHWAIEGWRRLHRRGHFIQPPSGQDAIQDLEDLGSPVRLFIRECCTLRPEFQVGVDVLYAAWGMWTKQNGRNAGTKQMFGRDLASAVQGVVRRRSTSFASFYQGIALTAEASAALAKFQTSRSRVPEADVD